VEREFQSRFGPSGWLKPYTSAVLAEMPARGVREATVVCPGFAVDCLETLEEIDIENRDGFLRAGGQKLQYVPALNARAEHARFLSDLIARHCQDGHTWSSAGDPRARRAAPRRDITPLGLETAATCLAAKVTPFARRRTKARRLSARIGAADSSQ